MGRVHGGATAVAASARLRAPEDSASAKLRGLIKINNALAAVACVGVALFFDVHILMRLGVVLLLILEAATFSAFTEALATVVDKVVRMRRLDEANA